MPAGGHRRGRLVARRAGTRYTPPVPVDERYRPDPRFPELGEGFFDAVAPARFPEHVLRWRNDRWAAEVGLAGLDDAEWVDAFARFSPLPDNLKEPLALRYHGHQFRNYKPQLGDGRGFLFAQLRDSAGRLLDLATKGSGRTPYSRGGDGRLTLKGGVRELLATEVLEARGVPTSKTFSLVETGERLHRHDEPSPTRACVLVRLSHSHVRFGSFQRHAFERRPDRVRSLMEHAARWYFPDLAAEPASRLPTEFLRRVCHLSARMCARWMAAGFVHGVLNTDNQVVTGESFDYGPWRFMPEYDERFTAAYFDEAGLYAYGQQPRAVLWNLTRLAECFREVISPAHAEPVMREFEPVHRRELATAWLERLNIAESDVDSDALLVDASVAFLRASAMPFDRFFHDLYGGPASIERAMSGPAAWSYRGPEWDALRRLLETRAPAHPGRLAHPLIARDTPVTMVIDRMESLWAPIAERDDWAPLYAAIDEIRELGALARSNIEM